jgi:hypothetical protein
MASFIMIIAAFIGKAIGISAEKLSLEVIQETF